MPGSSALEANANYCRLSAKERHRMGAALVQIIIVGVANTKEENAAGVATFR